MRKIINTMGIVLLSLNIIYLIRILFLDWKIEQGFEKGIVLITISLTFLYVLFRMFLEKKND